MFFFPSFYHRDGRSSPRETIETRRSIPPRCRFTEVPLSFLLSPEVSRESRRGSQEVFLQQHPPLLGAKNSEELLLAGGQESGTQGLTLGPGAALGRLRGTDYRKGRILPVAAEVPEVPCFGAPKRRRASCPPRCRIALVGREPKSHPGDLHPSHRRDLDAQRGAPVVPS